MCKMERTAPKCISKHEESTSLENNLEMCLDHSIGLEAANHATLGMAQAIVDVAIECACGAKLAPILMLHHIQGSCEKYFEMSPSEVLEACGKKRGLNIFKKKTSLIASKELLRHLYNIEVFLFDVKWDKLAAEVKPLIDVIKVSMEGYNDSKIDSTFKKLDQLLVNTNTNDGAQLLLFVYSLAIIRATTLNQSGDTSGSKRITDALYTMLVNIRYGFPTSKQFVTMWDSSRIYDLYMDKYNKQFKVKSDKNLEEVVEYLFNEKTANMLSTAVNSAIGSKPFSDILEDIVPLFNRYHESWIKMSDEDEMNTIKVFVSRLITIVDSLMVVSATLEIFSE